MATINSIPTRTTPGYVRSAMPTGYIDGLQLGYESTTSFDVLVGRCRDSTDTRDIVLSAGLEFDAIGSGTGALKIDTGTIASAKVYAVYIIASADGATVSGTFSLNATTPALPAGYTLYRKVGSFLTQSAAATVQWFIQNGKGRTRTMMTRITRSLANVSSPSTSIAAIDCSAMCPPGGVILLDVDFDADGNAGDFNVTFGPDGFLATTIALLSCARVEATMVFRLPIDSGDDIHYISSSATPQLVVTTPGFEEYL